MVCPACNYELLAHSEFCEHCGAPAYLATAMQASDATHCTYCGMRDDANESACPTCGLKKNFQLGESLIGTCRNCGAAWRNTWLYCQTCGVARENGLVDMALPMAARSLFAAAADDGDAPSPAVRDTEREVVTWGSPAWEMDEAQAAHLAETQTWLSEHEVVERMFVNGGSQSRRDVDLSNFLSDDTPVTGLAATPSREPLNRAAAAAVVYDLPVSPRETLPSPVPEAEVTPAQPLPVAPLPQAATALPAAANASAANGSANGAATVKKPVPQVQAQTDAAATAPVAPTEKTASAPVQTVRFINRSRVGATPPVDKQLVKIIVVLIALILIFSALIVSDFRLRDLFGRASVPAASVETTNPVAAPSLLTTAPAAPAGMVYVPGGTFRMGVTEGDSFETPAHDVTVAPFFMDRTEVTNEQYAEFVKATNHPAPLDWKDGSYLAGTAQFPVVEVSWQDANDYAAWAGKRLPTETEWEFAARALDGRRYPWGADWNADYANTSESQHNRPVAVGSFAAAAHPLGLVDLAGNVWEWTAGDVVSYKDSSIALAPGKVIRGGAFYAPKERATTTYRGFAPPDKKAAGIGFRCVKDVN